MAKFVLYHYEPSLAAASVAVVLFMVSALLHMVQMVKTRAWFLIPFVAGCCLEAIGYMARIASAEQKPNYTVGPYVTQSTLILIAPALLAASIYMELGRISEMVDGDSHLLLRRRWLTGTFVVGDVLSFLAQGSGVGLLASSDEGSRNTGSNIVVFGLYIQVVFFGCFVVVSLLFHKRLLDSPTQRMLTEQLPYRRHLFALYATSLLIFVRSIVRIVEFTQGFDGYVISHESFWYVFDALPMIVAVIIINGVHPGEIQRLLNGDKRPRRAFQMVHNLGSIQRLAE